MKGPVTIIFTGALTLLFPFTVNALLSGHGPSCASPCNPQPPDCDPETFFLPCTCTTEISWEECTMQPCQDSDIGNEDWYACFCNSSSVYTGRCYSTGCTLPYNNGIPNYGPGYNGNPNYGPGYNGNPNYGPGYNGNSSYYPSCQSPQCLGQPPNCTSSSMPQDSSPCSCNPSAFPDGCQMQPCGAGENTYDQYQCICTPEAGGPCWNDMCSQGKTSVGRALVDGLAANLENNPSDI